MAEDEHPEIYPRPLAAEKVELTASSLPLVEAFIRLSAARGRVPAVVEARLARAVRASFSTLMRENDPPNLELRSYLPAPGELVVELVGALDFRRLLPQGGSGPRTRQGVGILLAVDALTLGGAPDGRRILRLSFCF